MRRIDQSVTDPGPPAESASALWTLLSKIPSRGQVAREIRSMLGAGATTGHLLSWIGYLLATHPEKQERLRTEILSNLNGGSEQPALDLIESLPYLTAVIHEGLRLYPPAPYLVRKNARQSGKKRASVFMFSVWAMHRHPAFWSDPDEFVPERWSVGDPIPKAFIPFGLGPRVCIGKRFAMTEARVILIEILRRYRLAVPPRARKPVPIFTVLTRPKNAVHLISTPIT